MPSTGGNTCVANFVHTTIFPNGPKDFEDKDDGRVIGNLVGLNLFDDYGLWCNYGQLHRDLLIVTAKVCSSVFCQLKSMQKFAGINWKRVTLTSLKIFTTVWRIVWVS
ncbi:hypothetical protein ACLB1N_09845 [Escherichia coli]